VALFGLFLYVTLLSIPTWFGSVNSGGEHFEHRMYTSVIGLFLFISQLKINWDNSYIKYFAVLLFVVFVSATKLRMPIYKSEISFTEAGLHDAPDYFLFQVQKGEYEYEQRNFGEAITYFKNALALRKDKAEIYNGLANSYEGIGDHKNAVENFSKAIEIFGYQEVLYINRCTSNFNMNNYDGAMNDLIKLKQQNCKGIPAPLENAVKGKWIEQEFFKLNKLISQNPNVAENYFSRAKRYLNIQNYTNALIDVQKANELEPNNNDYKSLLNQLKENQK
jgi:tetratricopeptide (TPR) repeat protein